MAAAKINVKIACLSGILGFWIIFELWLLYFFCFLFILRLLLFSLKLIFDNPEYVKQGKHYYNDYQEGSGIPWRWLFGFRQYHIYFALFCGYFILVAQG